MGKGKKRKGKKKTTKTKKQKKKEKTGLDPQASTGRLGSRMKGRNPEQIWNGRVKGLNWIVGKFHWNWRIE